MIYRHLAVKEVKGVSTAELLRDDEDLRNDDLALTFAYWRTHDLYNPNPPCAPLTSPETIHRARQKLNEEGLYIATDPKVRKRRRRDEMREWASKD
jgi:hypothetical protein